MARTEINISNMSSDELSRTLRGFGVIIDSRMAPSLRMGIVLEAPIILNGMASIRPFVRNIKGYTFFRGGNLESLESIGRYCSVAPNVFIGGGNHPTDWLSTSPFQYENITFGFFPEERESRVARASLPPSVNGPAPIIGNDVWIGANVTINRGVEIGDGAVIAAGAVVVGNIPPYCIAGGVPAKPIRFRFNEVTIKALLEAKWWDRSHSDIVKLKFRNIDECIEVLSRTPISSRPVTKIAVGKDRMIIHQD